MGAADLALERERGIMADMFLPPATPWRPQQASEAGQRSGSMTAPRSAGWFIATLDRFADHEIPVPGGLSPAELRVFYATWRSELAA